MIADIQTGLHDKPVRSLFIDALPTSANGRSPFRPFQIVSLLDMVEFPLGLFISHYIWLGATKNELRSRSEVDTITDQEKTSIQTRLFQIENLAEMCDIDLSYFTGRVATKIADPGRTTLTLHELLSSLRAGWDNELRKQKFLCIPLVDVDYYDHDQLFGAEVHQKFSDAASDIKSAGNCYATGNSTACVYHLMRVSEFGMRRLAARLAVKLTHKRKPMPVEFATWDKVITACKNKINLIRQKPIGPKRQEQLELYSDAADHCLFVKDIWRNNASHTRQPYTPAEAMAAFERVRDFMKFLAVNEI